MARNANKTDEDSGDKPKKRGRPATGRKPTRTIFARVPPKVGKALDKYLASLRMPPTVTTIVLRLLEEFLRGEGFLSTDEGESE